MILAVTAGREVGVDIEMHSRSINWPQTAPEVFSPAELAYVASQPTEETRKEAFFRIWTRKEALLKAIGKGAAAIQPDSESLFRQDLIFGSGDCKNRWQVVEFSPATGGSGTLVVEWRPGPTQIEAYHFIH
jgi:phosphopantetheine--protein transferase-like protein